MTSKRKAAYAALAGAALVVGAKIAAHYGYAVDEEFLRLAREVVDILLDFVARDA